MKKKTVFLNNFGKSANPTSNIKLLFVMVIILLSSLFASSRLRAAPVVQQAAESIWSEPINLSRSGVASSPALFHGEAGGWQVFWMDQFDGLTTTRRSAGEWGAPLTIPLFISRLEPNGEITRLPVQEMPELLVDSQGTVHASWLGTLQGQETELVPTKALYYSEYTIGATAWREPLVITKSALEWDLVEDAAGQLHLVYIRPSQNEDGSAGVYYYRRPIGGDVFWVDGRLLYENIYFRRLSKEQATIQLASDEGLNLLAMWNNPQVQTSFYARWANNEQTWSSPEGIGNLPRGAKKAQVVTGTSGELLRLWQAVDSSCALYQQRSTDGGVSWGEQVEVLEELNSCPASWRLLRVDSGTILWVGGEAGTHPSEGSNNLTLAAWNGSQWSAPKPLNLPTETLEKEGSLTLNSLQVGLLGQTMAVVGQDQDGDIWFIESQKVLEDWLFAEPSPWTAPLNLYPTQNHQPQENQGLLGLPGLPTIATDKNGKVHVLWSEALGAQMPGTALFYVRWTGSRWTKPLEVLRAPGNSSFLARTEANDALPSESSLQFSPDSGVSKAEQPALIAVGEQLHAVWSGGYNGEVYYGRAKIDNTAPSEWSEPQPLPAPSAISSGCCPTIVADAWQRLHVVYALPLNEGRGLYYTRSEDGGESWLDEEIILPKGQAVNADAPAADWAQVTHPRLAVDKQGIIHVVWVRAELPGNFPFKGIYYARSTNGGKEWSEPLLLAEGAYNWPLLATNNNNQVHVVWQEASDLSSSKVTQQWHHRDSQDSGLKWAKAKQIPGFTGVSGPASLTANGAGTLYLAGISQESAGRSKLQLLLWNEGDWSSPTFFDFKLSTQPGIAIALQPALGKLDVAFRAFDTQLTQEAVWTTSRAIPTVEIRAAATFTPSPTTIPSPTPTPTPQPTPTITLDLGPPPDSTGQSTSLLLSALLAALAIGSILVVRFVKK
jgi:hypothetical protein